MVSCIVSLIVSTTLAGMAWNSSGRHVEQRDAAVRGSSHDWDIEQIQLRRSSGRDRGGSTAVVRWQSVGPLNDRCVDLACQLAMHRRGECRIVRADLGETAGAANDFVG